MSYENVQQHFRRRLVDIRESNNMTVREFCEKCGLSTNTYNYYVHRGGMPTLYTVMMIADRCGMTVDQLLGIKGGEKK